MTRLGTASIVVNRPISAGPAERTRTTVRGTANSLTWVPALDNDRPTGNPAVEVGEQGGIGTVKRNAAQTPDTVHDPLLSRRSARPPPGRVLPAG